MIPYGGTYVASATIYDPSPNAVATSLTIVSATLLINGVATSALVSIAKQSDGSSLSIGSAITEPRITASVSLSGRAVSSAAQVRLNVTVGTITQDVYLDEDVIGAIITSAGSTRAVDSSGNAIAPAATAFDPSAAVPANPVAGTYAAGLYLAASLIGRIATAQAGSTSSTIKLDASASATDNAYKDHFIKIAAGTGAGQFATITAYNGTSKVATIQRPAAGGTWTTTPDATSQFLIIPVPMVDLLPGATVQATDTYGNPLATAAGQTANTSTLSTISTSIANVASSVGGIVGLIKQLLRRV